MLAVLSPAKTLDESMVPIIGSPSTPVMLEDSEELAAVLKTKSEAEIAELMHISPKLAELNFHRYQAFQTPFNEQNSKQALLMFKGDVYEGLNATRLNDKEKLASNNHIRILSGLYGILKPLDLMQPYRLEMGTKLKNEKGKNLYDFWGKKIAGNLNNEIDAQNGAEKCLINLASNEYFKAIAKKALKHPIINVEFKEERDGGLKIVSFFAKKARGMMARHIIQNNVKNPEDLKDFNDAGYKFNPAYSSENELIFSRKQI